MPTNLPRSKRHVHKQKTATPPKPTLARMLANTFMVGSVLLLFGLVLLQEKRYADGEPGSVADAFIAKAQAALADDGAPSDTEAPPNKI